MFSRTALCALMILYLGRAQAQAVNEIIAAMLTEAFGNIKARTAALMDPELNLIDSAFSNTNRYTNLSDHSMTDESHEEQSWKPYDKKEKKKSKTQTPMPTTWYNTSGTYKTINVAVVETISRIVYDEQIRYVPHIVTDPPITSSNPQTRSGEGGSISPYCDHDDHEHHHHETHEYIHHIHPVKTKIRHKLGKKQYRDYGHTVVDPHIIDDEEDEYELPPLPSYKKPKHTYHHPRPPPPAPHPTPCSSRYPPYYCGYRPQPPHPHYHPPDWVPVRPSYPIPPHMWSTTVPPPFSTRWIPPSPPTTRTPRSSTPQVIPAKVKYRYTDPSPDVYKVHPKKWTYGTERRMQIYDADTDPGVSFDEIDPDNNYYTDLGTDSWEEYAAWQEAYLNF